MEDIQRCTELCAAILNEPDDRLVESVSAITAAFLDGAEGGYFPADTEVPGHLTLRVAPGNDPETFGWLAFTDTPQRARRLEALARLVADMLRQRVGRQRQEQMIEQIHDSIIAMDLTGFITDWNAGAERLFGYTAEEAIGRNVLFLYADEDEDDGLLQDHFLDHGGREIEVRRRRKSGEVFWASLSLSLVRDKRGFPMGLIGYLVDITPRIEAEQRLHLHASIFDSSEEGIMITDAQEHIVSVNPAFCRITGFIAAEVLGRPLSTFHSGRYDAPFYEEMWAAIHATGRWQGEVWGRRKSGEEFPQWASISAVRDSQGAVKHYFSIFSDITDRKRNEEQIHHLAYYDTLTTLPNRAHLLRLVGQALAAAQRNHARGAILFVDLNRFKPINDTLGHDAGDLLLIEIGRRFRGTLRQSDVVARIGGDEFVVALFDVVRHDNPGIVAQKLLTVLDLPFTIEGHELRVGASIGISLFPEDAQDTDTLLRYADIAMYRAKQTGDNGFIYYSQDMNQRSLDRIKTETGLRRALEQKELLLHYQPKVDLQSGAIIGAEALVRWLNPERGMVPPVEFISVAEESGLIIRIGDWVLEEACAQAKLWQLEGLPVTRIAVNLSARQFTPGLTDKVRNLLKRYALPAEWLELEITESMLMHSADSVIALMDALVALGVTLSLDDFGTGYSSLSYLKRFPIKTLKIDRSFIEGTPDDANDCAIAAAIVSMAKQLRHTVIAEGVETMEQAAFLRSLGCEEIQGYLFSPPVPADRFETFLREGRTLAL